MAKERSLEPGQTFLTLDGSIVMLDRRVPGDGTKWFVADWYGGSWSFEDSTIEPSDIVSHVTVSGRLPIPSEA